MAQNMGHFLRSMAYQMAKTNPVVRQALYKLTQQGPPIDMQNQKSIWRTVFATCVFHEKLQQP